MKSIVMTSVAFREHYDDALRLVCDFIRVPAQYIYVDREGIKNYQTRATTSLPAHELKLRTIKASQWVDRSAGRFALQYERVTDDLTSIALDECVVIDLESFGAEEIYETARAVRRAMFGMTSWPQAMIWVVHISVAPEVAPSLVSANHIQASPLNYARKRRLMQNVARRARLVSIFGAYTGWADRIESWLQKRSAKHHQFEDQISRN